MDVALAVGSLWIAVVAGFAQRRPAAAGECEVNVPSRTRPQVAQAFGVASMVLLGAGLLWLPHVVA